MKNIVTANQLKTRGIAALDSAAAETGEATVTMRGKQKYIVLTVKEYNRLRECELNTAVEESKKAIRDGRYTEESVEDHISRITDG